ncbi:MAG TPA: cupin domain-containing protein [Candidatus Acidoferrales bacterium]|nr:cupin domain-containing protein [Candidatus Acidoferrales bacterium]
MSRDERVKDLMAAFEKTTYFQWMKRQGIPIVEGYGLEDVRDVQMAQWSRTGGKAAFVNLYGMEGITGMYVAEIPAGGALEPEKHFYEEVICILEGQGATEVWQDGGGKQMFEWGPFSLFAPPLNTWHRLINGGRQPVKFLAVTNAPLVMDVVHNEEFVFNCPYNFSDRYSGADGFFNVGQKRYESGMQHIWETNFIMDIQSANLDQRDVKGAGVRITQFELSGNSLIGHLAQWPAGRYHKAHYHGAGAILFGLQSSGYVLLWSKELGIHPYENGRSGDVVEIKWKEGSVYCPPGGWFHQHFNTGGKPARHLAIRYGSRIHPIGFKIADKRSEDGVYIDVKRGGTLIEYADEDPYIRKHYEDELKKTGVGSEMPPV